MNYEFPKNKQTRFITLCVTESCNLHCSYCYENHKSARKMGLATAKTIVDKEFSSLKDDEFICLDFFGGEPFLNFETIKFVAEYLEKRYSKDRYVLFATTNGTLIHGEIQEWLKRQENFICELSLDGTKEMHDINRDNSFDKIDIDFFAKEYPKQEIKVTVSLETLPHLFEGIKFCHDRGFVVSANLAFGIDWHDRNNLSILEEQLNKLIEYYLSHTEIQPCSMLNFDISAVADVKDPRFARKWCGAGTSMHTYDPEGILYPCQFFMPVSLGEGKALRVEDVTLKNEIEITNFEEKCQQCPLLTICPMCYGSNYASTGNFYKVDDDMCQMTKVIMKARSYFRARQLELNQLNLQPSEKNRLIDAILKIQDMRI